MHLCEACARHHNLIPEPAQELNVPALLQFLLGQAQGELAKKASSSAECPHCGIKYAQFRAQGRLGCPEDYEIFRAAIEPLLEKIHRHTRHCGKAPACFRAKRREDNQRELRRQLQEAVRDERFEDAARLRDEIRSMGIADEP
jgi:protein arginine kinase activator